MNDPQDYTFASNVVVPKLIHAIKDLPDIDEESSEYVEEIPYIVSFTENEDNDSMWTHYNAEVSLELDKSYLEDLLQEKGDNTITAFFGKCEYASEENLDDAFIRKWKESHVYLNNLPAMAQYASVFIKRDAFRREREWRLFSSATKLYMVTEKHGVDCIETSNKPVKVKCIKDHDIVLYMEFTIPFQALKGIVINDTDLEHYHKVKKHLEVLLVQKGISPKTISIRQTRRYPL